MSNKHIVNIRLFGLGKDMEIFAVTPVILGGDFADPKNRVILTRSEHVKAVVYWNNVISRLKAK